MYIEAIPIVNGWFFAFVYPQFSIIEFNDIPFIFFSCSGGQRMMESSIALMQMSRTALAVNELKKKNIQGDFCF